MTTTPVRFYQVGSFAVGNRLLDESERTVQSDPIGSTPLMQDIVLVKGAERLSELVMQ